ncbi:5-dehydro-2-deoxygluconokinase [Propionicicella superfundia]|uniref:5-dehydro-2-deoxygluconokinase n=1 Tax=Propionicicella superfundia TaxID=348582 RepID=UPI0003F59DDC|nr:5-dehydro-2-deoxygluconokinase [Propionicicella superfundia]
MTSVGVEPLDLLTIGRCGVDIYPLQTGVGLEDVETFGKFLGGSPTNVAVAGARMGNRVAVVTGVGDDPFGRFVRLEMRRLGVDDLHVVTNRDLKTPVTFCEIFPPDDFPLYFYRLPSAPDLQLRDEDIPLDVVRSARVFWFTVTGLSVEPTRSAHHAALAARRRAEWTIADLDYRPMFWSDEQTAHDQVERVLSQVNVAIGNKEECRIAVGETVPDRAADALLDRGVDIAIVKQGPLGTLAKTREERIVVPVTPVEICNGLGAGDSFGGSFCHALLAGWDLARCVQFASTAGAIVASRLECSTAMPTEQEVLDLIAQHPESAPIIEKLT